MTVVASHSACQLSGFPECDNGELEPFERYLDIPFPFGTIRSLHFVVSKVSGYHPPRARSLYLLLTRTLRLLCKLLYDHAPLRHIDLSRLRCNTRPNLPKDYYFVSGPSHFLGFV